jgi:hypothetical protein
MGTYYSATTIIGYKVSKCNAFDTISVPNCEHQHGLSTGFCPECGKKIGVHEIRRYKDEAAWEDFYHFYNHLPCPFAYEYDEDRNIFWIGYGQFCDRSAFGFRPIKPYDEIKDELSAMLKSFTDKGIFVLDDREFGVWTLNLGH